MELKEEVGLASEAAQGTLGLPCLLLARRLHTCAFSHLVLWLFQSGMWKAWPPTTPVFAHCRLSRPGGTWTPSAFLHSQEMVLSQLGVAQPCHAHHKHVR